MSGNHCKIVYDSLKKEVFLHDLSTNGTYVFDIRIGKSTPKKLESGDLIYLLHKSKVTESNVLGFVIKFRFQ